MRGIIGIFITVGLLLMPVALSGGDRVKVKGNFPIYSGIFQSDGGDVISTPSRDDGTPGVHNEQPQDSPPLMEAHPFSDEWLKSVIPDFPRNIIIIKNWLFGSSIFSEKTRVKEKRGSQ